MMSGKNKKTLQLSSNYSDISQSLSQDPLRHTNNQLTINNNIPNIYNKQPKIQTTKNVYRMQQQQQYQEDEQLNRLIQQKQKQLQQKNKFRLSQTIKNENKKEQFNYQNCKKDFNEYYQNNQMIKSQTQSIQILKKQKNMDVNQIDFNKYHFLYQQSKNQAYKKLMTQPSNSMQSQFKSKYLKSKIVDQQLLDKQTSINIQNIPVYFPYQPYEIQKDYMRAVVRAVIRGQNALLQSPTGTGKTLSLLCSVLSWVNQYNNQYNDKINVIYCSRTHSQLRQVQSQLQKTCFRPTMSNFGSRDQFCIKQQFSSIKGRDLMQSCSKAVKLYLKSKRTLQLDQSQLSQQKNINQNESMKQQKSFKCCYYKSQGQYLQILQQNYKNRIVTSQMIKNQGKIHGFCPYYYAFQVKQKADLIFMPYNYILDVDRIPRYESIIKNSIIIFDQAHNVPEASCQGRSFSIVSKIFQHVQVELKKLQYHPYMSQQLKQVAYVYEGTRQFLFRQTSNLKKQLQIFVSNVHLKLSSSQNIYTVQQNNFDLQQIFKPHDLKICIYNWFGPQKHTFTQFQKLSIAKLKQIHMKTMVHLTKITKQCNDLIQALKQTYDGIFQHLQKLNGFIGKCQDLISYFDYNNNNNNVDWWEQEINHYRLSAKFNTRQGQLHYQLSLMCLTPSLTFKDILKFGPKSIILTSGTLTPLDSWQKQLKLTFHVQLTNKHVINRQQLHLGIIKKSLNNQSTFNFSYNQLRNNRSIYKDLLKTIIHFSKVTPNGMLVIFPSYKIIKNFKDQLTKDNISLNQLRNNKDLCFEDKGTIDFIMLNFKNKAKTKKGAILFCVCRGKVSEGLDFSDELCRAVIFIGVPYPNVKDPLLMQKRDYYDKLSNQTRRTGQKNLTGDQWYTLNTMRAVNQGIGRVIRHINDYGIILMLDNRYDQSKLKSMLPAWAKENMKSYDYFEEIDEKMRGFFTQMKEKFPAKYQGDSYSQQIQLSESFPYKKFEPKYNKNQQKKQKKQNPKNAFQMMMMNKNRINQNNGGRRKSKKKQLDFL